MKSLVKSWASCQKILEGKSLALFLDFDGTLSPIAPTPEQAAFPNENKTLLKELSQIKKYKLAVVSGRALKDLKNKVGIKGIVYIGNHGWEIEGPDIRFQSLLPQFTQQSFEHIKQELTRQLTPIKGVLIEDKGLTVALHYRLVANKKVSKVQRIFSQICEPYRRREEIKIGTGKKVIEIQPLASWNKGHAVSWLLKKYQGGGNQTVIPVYIGDDATDENAFAILKDKGLTVGVGQYSSQAQYYLDDTRDVTWFLEEILKLSGREKISRKIKS